MTLINKLKTGKKTKLLFCIFILFLFVVISFPADIAATAGQELPHLSLQDFLQQTELSFDEYIAAVKDFEEKGIFTYYLESNSSRYDAFQTRNPATPARTIYAYVNVNADFGAYNNIQEIHEPELGGVTMLVNKNFSLPIDWTPDDLVKIDGGFEVREEAAEYLLNLQTAMRDAGLKMHIRSTFRTSAASARLHSEAVSNWGLETADLNWARGGHSEHNTGLAADILHRTDTQTLTEARFETTQEFTWLKDNARDYGFILRYPLEYEDITGYKFEPWHWRFVGVDIAVAMHEENIPVYEEFYGRYLASDVLHNTKRLIFEQRALAEAEEQERLEREALEQQAAEDAARAQEEAERAEAEAQARQLEQAQREAEERAEQERLAQLAELEATEEQQRRDRVITLAVTAGFFVAMAATIIIMAKINKNKPHKYSR